MDSRLDVIVRSGMVVLKDEVRQLDIGIKDGKIAELAEFISTAADRTVNAEGHYVMPGVIDVHVHLDEPGLGDWEGFASGSAALAAGGCTTYVDMPLNGIPPTVNLPALQQKLAAAYNRSYVDYALWGGLVPGNLDQLELLAEAGVVGFKAFMSSPGSPDENAFREADDLTLLSGMKRIAELKGILALHAESEALTSALTLEKRSAGACSAADYTESRPVIAELEAVNRALFYAAYTGCSLHFVHVSSPQAVEEIHKAKQRGLDVTLETCPHYLALTADDLETLGPVAKCAPPLRTKLEQEGLWKAIADGKIDMIASDHSPCPTSMKEPRGDMFNVWGGISGAQSTLEIMFEEAYKNRGIPLYELSRLLSLHPARRFGLHPRKGEIAVSADADLAIIDPNRDYVLLKEDLYYKHPHSPYIGRRFSCRVAMTVCRGNIVYERSRGFEKSCSGTWIR